ncbi:3,4-dihydroxy 2-butanone 4-phosphate synthase/GTP cyclohydrolase II [Prauserella isguenensis]|uniref:3,4-dihydroxy-2-butanone-4-phosphate synthase n=1 Tax=Prauserella isguenensis TaxID=1470180 RepID=A0A839S8Y5_9PSEU|nr:3,4-dihydroxy 2-butanone 4-phosphate synthase/GTP cyclohydrolase II [Prauserella isguenensis]
MTAQLERPISAPEPSSIASSVTALRSGGPVLLVNDERPEVADVLLPAALAETEQVAWIVRHTSGLLRTPMPVDRADALYLPAMVRENQDPATVSYAVSVDAANGIGTGISARDRARTARVLADPDSGPETLCRPGHVLPVRVGPTAGPTPDTAAIRLCREADLPPVGLTAGLVEGAEGPAGSTTPGQPEIAALADRYGLPVVDINDAWFGSRCGGIVPAAGITARPRGKLTTPHGDVSVVEYRDRLHGVEHLAIHGDLAAEPPRLSVHIGCAIGDLLGSSACACRANLDAAVSTTAQDDGVLVYLRARHEFGLFGHSSSAADAPAALVAAVLADLGIPRIQLEHDAPISRQHLTARGVQVT